jgi:phosphoribosylamine--glycine ligase
MKSDLVPLLEATIDGMISSQEILWDQRPAVTVVLASGGYPDKYETGKTITGLAEAAALEDVQIFHAGTRQSGPLTVTAGGRVLAITALGATIESARGGHTRPPLLFISTDAITADNAPPVPLPNFG